MTTQTIRDFIHRHGPAAAGLCALSAALEARVTGTPLDPSLAARIDELLGALGAGDLLDGVSAQDAAPLLAELRFMHTIEARLMHTPATAVGWTHTDPAVLRAPGAVSGAFVQMIAKLVVPQVGLDARMAAPGAAFLDVGVGVAGLAIAMARQWPALRVVGIDPWAPSLALAGASVAASDVADRVELRERRVEELEDDAAFDLAWLPVPFIPEQVIPAACARIRGALKPGGWLMIAISNPGIDPAVGARSRMMMKLSGGGAFSAEQLERMLEEAGLAEARTIAGPPGAPVSFVVAKRP